MQSRAALCARCEAAIRSRPTRGSLPGVGAVVCGSAYEGPARRLVAALKFGGRLRLAESAADAIASAWPDPDRIGALVPVPPSPSRRRMRGYDPASAIAEALAQRTGMRIVPCLARCDGPRQVGRSRADRLARPPAVRTVAEPPAAAVLVDDVVTTGATLRACAAVLRAAGCRSVRAVAFARSE